MNVFELGSHSKQRKFPQQEFQLDGLDSMLMGLIVTVMPHKIPVLVHVPRHAERRRYIMVTPLNTV